MTESKSGCQSSTRGATTEDFTSLSQSSSRNLPPLWQTQTSKLAWKWAPRTTWVWNWCGIAEHDNVDMIVIATHGMTGWRRIGFGSVAQKIVEQAPCPVLVLRAKVADHSAEPQDHSSPSSATAGSTTSYTEIASATMLIASLVPRSSS
jgi:hypothetical protein